MPRAPAVPLAEDELPSFIFDLVRPIALLLNRSRVEPQRFATAALIVLTMYGVVAANGRSLAPAALFEDAARLSSRVYSRSSEFASETSGVLAEVDRIRSRVDEIFSESEQKTPEPRRPAAGKGQGA